MKNYTKQQIQFILKQTENFYSVSDLQGKLKATACKEVGLLKKDVIEEVYKITKLRNKRREASRINRINLLSKVEARLSARLSAELNYRQPSSDWVSVNNTCEVKLHKGQPTSFSVLENVVWHPKKSWKANETTHLLRLNPLDQFFFIGGLLTIVAKADLKKNGQPKAAVPCSWYEQTRGFQVKQVIGFLVNDYHIEANSLQEAKKIVDKRKKLAAARRIKEDSQVLTIGYIKKNFGFCEAGIRQFCERNGIDYTGSITFKELREKVIRNRQVNCLSYIPYLKKMGLTLNCK
jgi:hypothetical protein